MTHFQTSHLETASHTAFDCFTSHYSALSSKHHGHKQHEHKNKQERKEDDERMPLFPIVTLETKDLATRQLYYSDVPMLRWVCAGPLDRKKTPTKHSLES